MSINRIILFVFGFFGLILFLVSAIVFRGIKSECSNITIKNCWIFVLVLGLCLTTLSASYNICLYVCDNKQVNKNQVENQTTDILHYILFIIFFIILLGISSVILDQTQRLSEQEKMMCDENNLGKNGSIFILTFSIIGLIISLTSLYQNFKPK